MADWKSRLADLNPPAEFAALVAHADSFSDAWQSIDDPLCRVWLARAGGTEQAVVVGAVARACRLALVQLDVPEPVENELSAQLEVLTEHLNGLRPDADREKAADTAGRISVDLSGEEKDVARAVEYAIRAGQDAELNVMKHDFMWLMDAYSAIRFLVEGFGDQPKLSARAVDSCLLEVLEPEAR